MTIDAYFTFFALGFATILVAILGWSLWTGRIRHAGDVYLRRTAPAAFWMEAATYLLIITILLGGFVLARALDDATDRPPWGMIAVLATAGPVVLRSFWSREVRFGSNRFSRDLRPGPYWTISLGGLALCALALAYLLSELPLWTP